MNASATPTTVSATQTQLSSVCLSTRNTEIAVIATETRFRASASDDTVNCRSW